MYELNLAQELYCRSRARADESGARELELVRVGVGELAGVSPSLLRSAWRFVISETADETCRLVIETIRGRQVCPQCGARPAENPPQHLACCEHCKCHMRIESGGGVELLEIRVAQELVVA